MIYFFLRFVVFAFCGGVFAQVPDYETTPFPPALTSFTCHGRPPGYYADVETGCKTYHVCDGNSHFTYLCPRRTLFQQRSRTCDHSYLVRCQDSPHFFEGVHLPLDDEEIIRLATISEDSLPTERIPEEIHEPTEFIPTERTHFASEESTETTTILITSAPITETETEPLLNSSVECSSVNGQPPSKKDCTSQSTEKFLKIRLKDLRSLFFIPELNDNSVVAETEREFFLPLEKNYFMRFKARKEVSGLSSLCPGYCNPKFFLPGTCHPCIMIK